MLKIFNFRLWPNFDDGKFCSRPFLVVTRVPSRARLNSGDPMSRTNSETIRLRIRKVRTKIRKFRPLQTRLKIRSRRKYRKWILKIRMIRIGRCTVPASDSGLLCPRWSWCRRQDNLSRTLVEICRNQSPCWNRYCENPDLYYIPGLDIQIPERPMLLQLLLERPQPTFLTCSSVSDSVF